MTEDDKRNFGWRVTEALRFVPDWSVYLIDLRLGFKREGKWRSYLSFLKPVTQNFWNGIFTFNIYITKAKNFPMIFPRFGLVFRPIRNYWFQIGLGWLFDRGEFGAKMVITEWWNDRIANPGQWAVDGDPTTVTPHAAKDWNEGSV